MLLNALRIQMNENIIFLFKDPNRMQSIDRFRGSIINLQGEIVTEYSLPSRISLTLLFKETTGFRRSIATPFHNETGQK